MIDDKTACEKKNEGKQNGHSNTGRPTLKTQDSMYNIVTPVTHSHYNDINNSNLLATRTKSTVEEGFQLTGISPKCILLCFGYENTVLLHTARYDAVTLSSTQLATLL